VLADCSSVSNVQTTIYFVYDAGGFFIGSGCRLTDCKADGNIGNGFAGSVGINATELQHCSASHNTFRGVFLSGPESVVADCTVVGNGRIGIAVADRCLVRECIADGNGTATADDGIAATDYTKVQGCMSHGNGGNGISVGGGGLVVDNLVTGNGVTGQAAGIHSFGTGNRIEANHVRDNNGYGINAFDIDLSIRNSVGNNSTNSIAFDPGYGIGGDWGPFEPAFSNTHPSANFVDE
jgi:hypothetical protein